MSGSNAEAHSAATITFAGSSKGPSGSLASETFPRNFRTTRKASSVAFATPGSAFFQASLSQPKRRFFVPSSWEGLRVKEAWSTESVPRSLGSCPEITESTVAQSSAVLASGPILSMEYESAMAPYRLTRPNVGRKPVTPQNAEGQTIEPHVSVPMANGASAAATMAPEPDDEPQVQQSRFQGFLAAPEIEAEAKR